MVEYIEKEVAVDLIGHELRCGATVDQCGLETAFELLCGLPPADVCPVKRGKWIVKQDKDGKTYGVCSCCGYEQYAGHLKYCPECGGKMDGPNQ